MWIIQRLHGSFCEVWTGAAWSLDVIEAKPFFSADEAWRLVDAMRARPKPSFVSHIWAQGGY